jgi:hypothetical protein
MSQSAVVALVGALAWSHPYLSFACVLFWIYRNSSPR